ncbi:hypothetical protein CHU94_09590 [Rhodoferax sp. TH121]|uniref:hypothetical protein n=1 Tax=Rhodoferax sp. TH121 TaxID=2022803 RepID=UPI000B963AC5|nr:hypothetical protein [Rhodoferax sp. TH121]OYQ41325.1 hypothetical protein CHU94_09590 [Rhodoferax sp. TH121]
MDGVNKNELAREALLEAVVGLNATRDELMTCAELLREDQFNTDLASRRIASEIASELIGRSKSAVISRPRD